MAEAVETQVVENETQVEGDEQEASTEEETQPTSAELRIREVDEARKDVNKAEAVMLARKAEYDAAKKQFELAICKLRTAGMPLPLFDGDGDGDGEPDADADPDAWKSFPICDLDLKPGLVSKLADAGYTTIGQLSQWTGAGNLLTDIEGIGETKATLIEAALETYWREHPVAGGEGDATNDATNTCVE